MYVMVTVTVDIATRCQQLAQHAAQQTAITAGESAGYYLFRKLTMGQYGEPANSNPDLNAGVRSMVELLLLLGVSAQKQITSMAVSSGLLALQYFWGYDRCPNSSLGN